MQVIRHRVNSIQELQSVPKEQGCEIDLRTFNQEIILSHDPFQSGTHLTDFLKSYKGRDSTLILNVKEDSLEEAISRICCQYEVPNYFFTDLTVPALVRLTSSGVKAAAVRVSDFEPVETAKAFQGKASWVWYDSFSGIAPKSQDIKKLQDWEFRICLVSPELHGYDNKVVEKFRKESIGLRPEDAVCTKFPALWGNYQ